MRVAGIDIASRTHVLTVVGEAGETLVKPTSFGEDAAGYEKAFALLGPATDIFVAMEATGHYGRNLFVALCERGYRVARLNPARTRRFAQEDLVRAKTDSVDALGIARFAAQKRPPPTPLLDDATNQLRELVHFLDRLTQDFGDRVRQIHRLVDLGFPEFDQHVRTLDSQRATAILAVYPTAQAFTESSLPKLAALRYDGVHTVGLALARSLVQAAKVSVGRHHGPAYNAEMEHLCRDLDQLRLELRDLYTELERRLAEHPVGSLLTTIDGLGTTAVARIIAAVDDPARFRSGAALAAYVGAVPGTNKSGLRQAGRASLSPLGNARLRRALYMTTLAAVRSNPWLCASYQRLRANGKPPKVALLAAMRKLLLAVYSVAKHRQPFVLRLPREADGSVDVARHRGRDGT
jgi:transposase